VIEFSLYKNELLNLLTTASIYLDSLAKLPDSFASHIKPKLVTALIKLFMIFPLLVIMLL